MIFRLLVLLFLLINETVVTFVFIAIVMRCESLADLNYLGFLLPFYALCFIEVIQIFLVLFSWVFFLIWRAHRIFEKFPMFIWVMNLY